MLIGREHADVVNADLHDAGEPCTADYSKIKDLPEKFGKNR
jgi:hypothetical protein